MLVAGGVHTGVDAKSSGDVRRVAHVLFRYGQQGREWSGPGKETHNVDDQQRGDLQSAG